MLRISDVMLEGKKALVTGAGQGIGKAIALTLANFGADIAIVDVNEATANETAREVQALGRKAIGVKGDVGRRPDVEGAMARTVQELGGLDILVNNAMVVQFKPALWITDEEWDEQIRVNLRATFLTSRAAATRWIQERLGGVIVNVASTEGIRGCPNYAAYTAAKAGMISLTKTLSSELGPYGIRVNAVAPDYTPTPGVTAAGRFGAEVQERVARFIPLRRIGSPDDTAGVVLFLAGGLSSWVSGATIVVDGGSLACARVEGPMRVAPLR